MYLILEALLVGIIVGLAGLGISTLLMVLMEPKFTFNEYTFWPRVLLGYIITGFLTHLFFDAVGINKIYCKYGNACVTESMINKSK